MAAVLGPDVDFRVVILDECRRRDMQYSFAPRDLEPGRLRVARRERSCHFHLCTGRGCSTVEVEPLGLLSRGSGTTRRQHELNPF